ncbi:MAG: beta-N-acetylhexosaminidase [Prolixibacteraceae bacterium]|nr:beta-N-acetylhexosaminidase [Prolixibacteraceae bacterium]
MRIIFLVLVLLFLASLGYAQKNSIIPEPASCQFSESRYLYIDQIRFSCQPAQEILIQNFSNQLAGFGIKLGNIKKSGPKTANLILGIDTQKQIGLEAYSLTITPQQIQLTASSETGLFYGLQSLTQLAVSNSVASGFRVPHGTIQDNPRYVWRGLMLDESRHFFGKEKVKQLLDWMAFYKLNRFHWHLTDEPGWRIEIKKYPKLTSVGAIGNFHDPKAPAAFYTQADIKEIVHYAAERSIEVVPEIDMPGHAAAANRAYPEFSGGGSEKYPEFTFNPGKEHTYGFLTDILREVVQLFPSKYIHLGGDEVHFGNQQWNTNADVQSLMQKHQLKDLQAVEFYFINRMTDSIAALNKTMIGWDEIVTSGVPAEKCLTMWWRHDKPEQLQLALEKGYHTILCPRIPFYFDFVQHNSHRSGRYWAKEYAPIEKILAFNQTYAEPLTKYPNLIDGIQANIWTETIHSEERLDFMTFPRMAALAEVAWSKNNSPDYSTFLKKMQVSFRLYKEQKITFFDPVNPERTPELPGPKK